MLKLSEKVYIKKGSNWDLICIRDSVNNKGEKIVVEDKYYYATVEQAISRAIDYVMPEEAESLQEILESMEDCKKEILAEVKDYLTSL